GDGTDPDFTSVYDENGSLNMAGYHTDMDYDEALGTGINEWYMKEGTQIMPPNSEERIQHYWNWEQYLMDKICPIVPTLASNKYVAYWSNLKGYNYSNERNKGIQKSWGKMSWDGSHIGQANTWELVIADTYWNNLNPLFQNDTSSSFISNSIMDPLFWYDSDLQIYPHIANNLEMINDTYARITIREGIKWQPDPDNLFLFEYLDAEDVFFTLYSWKHVSNDKHLFDWIKDMKIVDDYTLDIFIDGDPSTTKNELFTPFLSSISKNILPEHYLNQTQELDGITPDINDPSWNTFEVNPFGSGLFEFYKYTEGFETILAVDPDCWWLDPTITNDLNLQWENRFGRFSNILTQLRIRIIPNQKSQLLEFEAGEVDLCPVTESYINEMSDQFWQPYSIQSAISSYLNCFVFNMREVRPMIGNRTICPNDPTLTVGLALRKAISYAINKQEMNEIIHGGLWELIHHPISPNMGVWLNPNIIKYDYDLEKAKEYMAKAGYLIDDPPTTKWYHSFRDFFVQWWPVILGSAAAITIICFSVFGFIKLNKKAKRLKTQKNEYQV
ncbi:MAG: ABC transporter substrate-binding protein, partial [Candidatus Heimdallarchaeota archaeon]